LDNKAFDIIEARCNHEDVITLFFRDKMLFGGSTLQVREILFWTATF